MKSHPHSSHPFLSALVVGAYLAFVAAGNLRGQTPKPTTPAPLVDSAAHAAHVAGGTHPATPVPDAAKGDPSLSKQLSQLQAKLAQLEAALAKSAPPIAAVAMPGMSAGQTATPAMVGMGGTAPPTGGEMNMMSMMDKMMGMMDKMMSMGGGGMGMGMDMMKMGAVGLAGMGKTSGSGGTMGMMGMGGGSSMGAMPQSALPGFPGASHLYHIGGTGFFLDHPQHIALTTEQQAALNKAKEQALLAKSTADRAVEQAEQALWMLTAADQPDAAQIEANIREIEKLRGDERFAFIRAVGEASKLLTDEQRQILTGFAPPAPAAAAPMPGMKGM